MRLGELLLGDAQGGAYLAEHRLMLSLLLRSHFLHNPLVLCPVIRLVGLPTALHAILEVRFLAFLSNLSLTVHQSQEVIRVQNGGPNFIAIICSVVDNFSQALLLKLINDKLLANMGLDSRCLLPSILLLHHCN